ncbi:MAG: hypothetical protein ABJB86_23150, partial [Bacteroidota bacterium]
HFIENAGYKPKDHRIDKIRYACTYIQINYMHKILLVAGGRWDTGHGEKDSKFFTAVVGVFTRTVQKMPFLRWILCPGGTPCL